MTKNQYRLDEYIITEYDEFVYTWEMNIVLGEHRTGNCFIFGDILVFGPWSHVKDGCLKLEFHAKLKKLLPWTLTRYHCLGSSIQDTTTGRTLSDQFYRRALTGDFIEKGSAKIIEPGTFRLGRYKIVTGANGDITWQTYDGLNNVKWGSCVIKSGLLFLKEKGSDFIESQSKKKWLKTLKAFPKWDQSVGWSQFNSLHNCQQSNCISRERVFSWKNNYKIVDKKVPTTFPEKKNYRNHDDRDFWHKTFALLRAIPWGDWLNMLFSLLKSFCFIGLHLFLSILNIAVNLFAWAKEHTQKIISRK